MGHSLDVYVRNSNGSPMVGVGIEMTIDGIVCGGSLHDCADDEGHVQFDTGSGFEDSRELAYVGDRWFGPFQISGGSYTIRLAASFKSGVHYSACAMM
jgi:hypothetical protein